MTPAEERFDQVAQAAARRAELVEPWATAIMAVATAAVFWEAVGEPLSSAATSSGYYSWRQAGAHVLRNLIDVLSAIFLLGAGWAGRAYLARLRKVQFWTTSMGRFLRAIAFSFIAAAVAQAIAAPLLAHWIGGGASLEIALAPSAIALAGLGLLLVFLAPVLDAVAAAASDIKRDNDQFV